MVYKQLKHKNKNLIKIKTDLLILLYNIWPFMTIIKKFFRLVQSWLSQKYYCIRYFKYLCFAGCV